MASTLRIISYFSLPTDLAAEMRDWPEFLSGNGYSVDLKDPSTDEEVTMRLVETDDAFDYLAISSNAPGKLFDRAVGRAVFALLAHSDDLMIHGPYD